VVALFQHGVTQAVATLGTATTPDHAELLFRNAPDVFFCFDGDAAGRKAATRAMESVLPRMRDGRQAFFLFLPDGEDPDTLVRSEGAAGFDARLQHATPLSQFLFDSLSADVNLATLDGKARLAERAKPMLAQIPEGAFGDLMRQRLTELTGVGARNSAAETHVPVQRARNVPAGSTPRRSLVRNAIALLLQQPSLALELQPPYRFVALRQPGIELLTELIALASARPDITTGSLVEHFEGRDEATALQKLASQTMPGEEAHWREEFLDTMAQLDKQMLQQRVDELQAKQRDGGLDDADKTELRALLSARMR
jgi:DNA primase